MLLASAMAFALSGVWGLAQVCERLDTNHGASVTRAQRAVAAKAKLPAPSSSGPAIIPLRVELPALASLDKLEAGVGVRPVAVLSLGGPSDRAPPA